MDFKTDEKISKSRESGIYCLHEHVLFFCPTGVSSTYSGRGCSLASFCFAFFSLVFEVPSVLADLRAFCFSANFLFFSAFFLSFSTVDNQLSFEAPPMCLPSSHLHSFSVFIFFPPVTAVLSPSSG